MGLWWERGGGVGWNVYKGYEIGLCIDGTPNQIFHVLLHELAHCTVPEYEHSPQFWQNFRELRDIAVELKIMRLYQSTGFLQDRDNDHRISARIVNMSIYTSAGMYRERWL